MYFMDRKVKEHIEAVNGQIGVTYDDDKEPQTEVMGKDEWEKGSGEEPILDRQKVFVESSNGMQKEMLDAMLSRNVRWEEIQSALNWVGEAISQVGKRFLTAFWRMPDFQENATVGLCMKLLEEKGGKFQTEDLTAVELLVLEKLVEADVKFKDFAGEVKKLVDVNRLSKAVESLQRQALEAHMGRPASTWRMDDIQQFIEQYEQLQDKPEPQPVEGAGGEGVAVTTAGGVDPEQPTVTTGSPVEGTPEA